MKKFARSTRFSALALSTLIAAGAGTASAEELDFSLGDAFGEVEVKEYELGDTKLGYIEEGKTFTSYETITTTIDGTTFDVNVQIDEIGTFDGEDGGVAAKGWAQKFGQWLKGKLADVLGGGGGGGGGSTQTCNVNVTIEGGTQSGDVNINVGNLNCGTQSGGSGGGNSGGTGN